MKVKRLVIIACVLTCITLSGCKKCADCTTVYTQQVTGQQTVTSSSTQQLCGDELKEVDQNPVTTTSTVNGYTATITTKTTCD